jgi:hypothetical protein
VWHVLRQLVIFRGKKCAGTKQAPLQRFSLLHKSRLLSILAPPSFPPFRSLKTRLQCLHLLLPTVSSPLPPTLSLAHLQLVPSFPQLWYLIYITQGTKLFSLLLSIRSKEAVSRKSAISDSTYIVEPFTLCFQRFRWGNCQLFTDLRGETPGMSVV